MKVTSLPEVRVSKFKKFPLLKTIDDKVVLGVVLLAPLMNTDWRYPWAITDVTSIDVRR